MSREKIFMGDCREGGLDESLRPVREHGVKFIGGQGRGDSGGKER